MGDVRVQRMFLGVVGKSRKMPGRQETTHWQTSELLLVRPGPPNNNNNSKNKQANAAPGKEHKNNKRKQTTRNEKRKKQMQIQGGRVRSGTVDCDHLLLPVLALLDCGCVPVVVAVWLRVLSLFIYAPKRFIFIFIWPRESTLLAERDLKTGLLAPVSGYKIVSCDFYLCRRRQRMLSNR